MLDTALAIAAEAGLGKVTMGAVAARMGVTRPVVYACYGGRGELLAALLERETELALSGLMAMLPPKRTGSIEQLFVDGFRLLLGAVDERPASWRIMFGTDPDPVLAAAIARGRNQIRDQVAAVMRPLLQRRKVADVDTVLIPVSEMFLAISESAIRMLLDDTRTWRPDGLAEIFGPAAYRATRVD